MTQIILAEHMGFCFGVRRAFEMALKESGQRRWMIGQLVHSDAVQKALWESGVEQLTLDQALSFPLQSDDKEKPMLILRSHGTDKEAFSSLAHRFRLVDTTCPVLLSIYRKIEHRVAEGYWHVLIGDPGHPEVQATASRTERTTVVWNVSDIENLPLSEKLLITMQTTLNETKAASMLALIQTKAKNETEVHQSICRASKDRRSALQMLMRQADVIAILGDRHSNNTRELAEICRANNFPFSFGNSVFSLDLLKLKQYNRVGISAGASTPDWIIKEAVTVLNDNNNEKKPFEGTATPQDVQTTQDMPTRVATSNPMEGVVVGEESTHIKSDIVDMQPASVKMGETENVVGENDNISTFASTAHSEDSNDDKSNDMMACIDDTFTRIRRGQIVNGTVLYVTDSQVMVNINYRSDGIIDRDELPEGMGDPREHFKEGQELEVYIVKLDDGDGNVVLSLRRIKDVQAWNEMEEKFASHEPVDVYVKETTKGGLIVEYKGTRAFMPGSQAYARFRRDLSGLVGQTVQAELIDFDKSKRRAVFSRRELEKARIEKEQETFWSSIEEGQLRKGTVQRLTNFGAFVDLGGVDGLIHVTDLSWNRVHDPKEVLSVGQEVEVIVLGFDREKERVSLGLKQTTEEPWQKFINNNKIGDVVKGTVVTMPDFGAFVRLPEGVDGLLHISQICKEHIEKPSDVLNIGQEVEAKIIDIKPDRKISLSVRALTEPMEQREPRERKPRRERSPRNEDQREDTQKLDVNPINNPLIDSEILGELKKMAQETEQE